MELRQKEEFTDEEDDDREEIFSEFETSTDSEFEEEIPKVDPFRDLGMFMRRYKYLRWVNFLFKSVKVLELPRPDYVHVILKTVGEHLFIAGILRK